MAKNYKPVVLIVLDGFGVNISNPESTWKHAELPTVHMLEQYFPFTTLQASGVAVGLPWGQEGNSEVGHFTMGAGRALFHHLPRIITAIQDESFFKNTAFLDAVSFVKKNNSALHLMGLFSSGSVHAYVDHLYALLDLARRANIARVYLHLFTDGKDAPPKEAALFLKQLEERLANYPFAKIVTISGRNFTMDRDENWDRIERAYKCLTEGSGDTFKSASEYVESFYERWITDEAIEPGRLESKEGRIGSGDVVIFYNFREDSVREIVSAFVSDNFNGFAREKINNLFFVTMTEYDKNLPVVVAFPPLDIDWPLARVISEANLKQLHIAETEKYAHVNYFFNGGKEKPFPGEDRILVPSPKIVHFDEMPEMSAGKITDYILENFSKYDFIVVNFANGDMVGHTGNFAATVKAIEVLDLSIGKIIEKVLEANGCVVVTADHGNAEEKITASGERRTKHTGNPVPFFVVNQSTKLKNPRSEQEVFSRYMEVRGVLADIAPTVLGLIGLRKPAEMTGVDLLPKIK